MVEQNPFFFFQDYKEPGADPDVRLVATKSFLLTEVPNAPDLDTRVNLVGIAEITFGSGLENLLLQGVKPQTIINSSDIGLISFLLRLSQAEIDAFRGITDGNLIRASNSFVDLVSRGVPIPTLVIERIEQSVLAPCFRATLEDLRAPADLSGYGQNGKGLIRAFGL